MKLNTRGRLRVSPLALAWLTSLWVTVLSNGSLWQALYALPEMATLRGRLFMLAFSAIVFLGTGFVLTLAAWRWSIKPIAAVFLVSSAFGAYFMDTYRIVIDASMITNALQTNWAETRDLLSMRMLAYALILAVVPMVCLWRTQLTLASSWKQLQWNVVACLGAVALMAALLMSFFADMSGTMRNHKSLRYLINPLNSFYALGTVAASSRGTPAGPVEVVGADARIRPSRAGAKLPPLLVLVVGETARAENFGLNGYSRHTTPELAARHVLNFSNVSSCGTNTATSVPCMFSVFGKTRFQAEQRRHENLLDVVQRAGMAVLWIDNQSGCKGVCDRVHHTPANQPVVGMPAMPTKLCDHDECLDGILLHGLEARIAALPAEQRARGLLIIMHQMGSHGPAYSKRSPVDRKPFVPECKTNVLQQCGREELINAYDNSIAYTDHVLASTIDWLKTREKTEVAALLYVSDHGESLGENNLYLHGLPYALAPRQQTHVPMISWLSSSFEIANGLTLDCLKQQLDRPLSHDHLSHTTLGLLGIETSVYQPSMDAFSTCRAGLAP